MSSKRKMPIKTVDLDFTDDGYPGFHAKRRTNAPIGVICRYLEINKDTPEEEARRLILELYPEWDFVDDDGKPVPHTLAGFDLLSGDLLTAMQRRGAEALRNVVMSAPLGSSSSTEPGDSEQGD